LAVVIPTVLEAALWTASGNVMAGKVGSSKSKPVRTWVVCLCFSAVAAGQAVSNHDNM
jgi:hypothetical protein